MALRTVIFFFFFSGIHIGSVEGDPVFPKTTWGERWPFFPSFYINNCMVSAIGRWLLGLELSFPSVGMGIMTASPNNGGKEPDSHISLNVWRRINKTASGKRVNSWSWTSSKSVAGLLDFWRDCFSSVSYTGRLWSSLLSVDKLFFFFCFCGFLKSETYFQKRYFLESFRLVSQQSVVCL